MPYDFTEEAVPMLYKQCVQTYRALKREANRMVIDDRECLVYKGHITVYLDEEVGISTAQYGRVMNALKEMGCVVQYKRGSGKTTESEWILTGDPSPTVFAHWKEKKGVKLYKMDLDKEHIRELQTAVRDLHARLSRVESDLRIRE